ncbi:hypothetical protein DP23_4319 [Ralstonia pickettii]|nr:hypothetical protein DP23_4319 [Ralstonia pickettii]
MNRPVCNFHGKYIVNSILTHQGNGVERVNNEKVKLFTQMPGRRCDTNASVGDSISSGKQAGSRQKRSDNFFSCSTHITRMLDFFCLLESLNHVLLSILKFTL